LRTLPRVLVRSEYIVCGNAKLMIGNFMTFFWIAVSDPRISNCKIRSFTCGFVQEKAANHKNV